MLQSLALSLAITIAAAADPAPQHGFGGGPLRTAPAAADHDCIHPDDHAAINAALGAMRAADERGANVPRFRFFPQAGLMHRDLQVANYVDLLSGAAIGDYRCSALSYNGHNGHDILVRSFAEQAIGVPVYAALDGTVVLAVDGHPDMNTEWAGQPANYVVIDHGNFVVTYYYHFKNGSVAVSAGQPVVAGQQIGLTASSGVSTYPHLHFEVRRFGVRREPLSGACNGQPSLWTDPIGWSPAFFAHDTGITHLNLDNQPGLPFTMPRTGQIALSGDTHLGFWVQIHALPANSTWRTRVIRADGTTAIQSGTIGFGNATEYSWSWWYWWWQAPGSFLGGALGEARVQLTINNQLLVDAPFQVVATRDPTFNRPPAPVSARIVPAGAVAERPAVPSDVLVCEVDVDLLHDDPDYDVVRFEYVWTVDDVEVRRLTSAAHSDLIPAGAFLAGQTVRCEVTPSDGRGGVAPTVIAQTTILAPCPGDTNGDRVVNFEDLNIVVGEFNQAVYEFGLRGDLNQDGFVDFADLNETVSFFNLSCN